MANETVITLVGNLVEDPEMRFTSAGLAVVHFTVASTERVYDKTTQQWKDGPAMFLRCTGWRQMADNIAESLGRGDRVVVCGILRQRRFETKDGQKRTDFELEVQEVGPSLRFATAKPVKPPRPGETAADGGWSAPPAAPTGTSAWDVPAMASAGGTRPQF